MPFARALWMRPLGIDALPSTAEEETAHAGRWTSRHSPFAQPSTRLDPPPSHAEVIAWQALRGTALLRGGPTGLFSRVSICAAAGR